ncbi:cysteine synthase A [Anaerorhabdus sp.]|jgi:cysteine synthase|uniref:cysteine synthase A n=1 Tax=Anaerorhabdus sp. TaxID=1872524 RepID=UPI002FC814E3
MKVDNILETIGETPLVKLNNLIEELSLEANLYAKVEFFNPGGSVKDRVAYNMINEAIKEGDIEKDATIIEPTSGNTGIGLAMVAAALGMRCILVMPETMSIERRKLIEQYGAELVLTEGSLGMKGSIDKAHELAANMPNSFIPSQFENPTNPSAHMQTTGIEILRDLKNDVDMFVACIGTGGTISGVGKILKMNSLDTQIIGVEPKDSPLLTEGIAGPHKIQGIGANFVPINYDPSVVDKIETATLQNSIESARLLGKKEGILVGLSSGAALSVAIHYAKLKENKGKNIVVLLPDTGERYLSTDLFK